MSAPLVTRADVLAAAERIAPHTVRTPLLRAPECPLWVKAENQQPTGSFKVRGAVNAVTQADAGRAGLVVQSSGNHGHAMAYAGARCGVPVTVVVPDTAPPPKTTAIRRLGATVVTVPPTRREQATVDIAAASGATVVRADDPEVLAGQGTVGLEIVTDLPEAEVILVPVGNGGLLAGVALAVKAVNPAARIIGVEPELAADAAESLRRGALVRWPAERTYRTVADGLRLCQLGPAAWTYVRRYVDDIVTVGEESIVHAMGVLLDDFGLVAEPSGAVAAAAFYSHRDALPGGTTVAILSGGNVDAAAYHAFLAASLADPVGSAGSV